MKFSVIVVNKGDRGMLSRCLTSIAQQTQRDIEVLVVGLKHPLPDERFRCIEADTSNIIAAKNLAARQAAGEWLLFLGATSVLEDECLARLYAASLRFPDCAMFAATQLDNAAPEMLAAAGKSYFFAGFPFCGGKDWPMDVLPDEGECFGANTACIFIQKNVFEQLGGFDDEFETMCEDTDLAFRLRLAGHHAILASEAVLFVTEHPHKEAYYYTSRNIVWTFVKNMPDALFYPLLPLHILIHVFMLCDVLHFNARLSGLIAAFKHPKQLWQKRKSVQSARKASFKTIARALTWGLSTVFWRKPDIRRRR
ncbi:MAG: glycosyltransferase [Alphaproteobacteria bacterium]|nr:glycosyltransferase [Alphaproteobacteria bacterium]